MSYLGLDIGTGGCKAVVFTGNGKELAYAFREYPILHPYPGWAELNPDEVISNCFEVIKEVNSKITDPVISMSISSQGEAFTPIGSDGCVLGNAMVSSDSRARDIAASWSEKFGTEKIYQITGHTPHPLFTLYKILWIKENQPDVWNNARYFLCFEDLFHLRMGLEPHISWPMAGRTMLFDVINHQWSNEILQASGVMAEKLAIPIASGEIIGTIGLDMVNKLGFKNPVVVVAGGHDQTCAALGAGVVELGMCMYATGTVECFCPILDKPGFSSDLQHNNLCCYDYTIKGKYTSVAYSLTGGNILRWMRDELGQSEISMASEIGQNPYTLLLDAMPETPTDLLVLPYFTSSGTPYFDTRAKGAIIGLQLTTTKGEITRALLEGVAMEMKLNLRMMEQSGMDINTFIATGGGTRNSIWTQLKADVLNKKIVVRNITETGCFGAALLACSAIEHIPVEQLLRESGTENEIFSPDPEKAKFYDRKFEIYKNLYPVLKQFWKE
ncbi:MAG: FGGY-family carbohydrate kinase [Bacteroidales bacterium]|nr:FGGY-family carbohydrate kinase [Bacteroidales bacterium]